MVSIHNLNFSYGNRKKLFSGLNLELIPGNIYGLLGRNGVGKTSLLKIISGLLFSQSGECRVLGINSMERNPSILSDIYLIPEEFYTPPVTIGQYEFLQSSFYPKFDHKKFLELINEFGLSLRDKLTAFSYGQKKKFLLAFGAATNSRLFILDEPTNGLDIPSKSQFRKLLASSISENRIFIISTHQVRDMENLIDPIIILDDGKIVFNQTMEDISSRLEVSIRQELENEDKILYSEKIPGGYSILSASGNGIDTRVDIEILFNAVIANSEKMKSLFNSEAKDVH